MNEPPITTTDPLEAARQWFGLLSSYCAAVDFDSAEAIFAGDVVSFGTKAAIVAGMEHLRRNQWEGIWPNIRDFRIDVEHVEGGGNEDTAWGVANWNSTGFDEQHEPFDRPGRATVILERREGRWLAVHTHFSLAPGTPQRTFGVG
ncbi:MAG: nuclear transport factor 2 family protein [Dehalococcoidia bacterium]